VSVNAGGSDLKVKPARIHLLSNEDLFGLRWTSWGGSSASATGTDHGNAPSPGHNARNPVLVKATDRRDCGGKSAYTTIRIHFTRGTAYARQPHYETYAYGCPGSFSAAAPSPSVSSSAHRPLSAASAVRSCRPRYFGLFDFRNGRQEYVFDLSVRNMTCGSAIRALHNAVLVGWPPNLRTGGFGCYILSGGGGGATDRCVHNRPYKAFRVSIAT
jgi:hypothetical protein